jgi:hypothetical protein
MLVGRCPSKLSGHELHAKINKVTASQDDGFVGFRQKHPKQVGALIGGRPRFEHPYGDSDCAVLTLTLYPPEVLLSCPV